MKKIRTFIAIPLPEEVLAEIEQFINSMKSDYSGVKWLNPKSIHLTLKFLGELNPRQIDKVMNALELVFEKNIKSFDLSILKQGTFPNFKKPRVLWLGLGGKDFPYLLDLKAQIEEALGNAGFAREQRKFSPHLTIGRVKYENKIESLVKDFRNYSFPALDFSVKNVHVMKSDLRPSGAVYSIQKSFNLID